MTDVNEWIKERRRIHNEATDGAWVAEYSGETGDCVIPNDAQSAREAVAVTRLFHRTADANAIADAHNTLPAALSALEKVLGLHVKGYETAGAHWCSECETKWPCSTVQAIEGAINEQ